MEPLTDFQFPVDDTLPNQFQDFVTRRFGAAFDQSDVAWLSNLVTDFLADKPSLSESEFRTVAERFVQVLCAIDKEMSRYRTSRTWKMVATTFALPSALERGYTQAGIGAEFVSKRVDTRGRSLTKMAIGKRMRRLAASAGIQLAFKESGQFRNLEH